MLKLRNDCAGTVFYASPFSAGFDIESQTYHTLEPGERYAFSTGLYLDQDYPKYIRYVDGYQCVPQLEIRARSGLAHKEGITVLNGVGTVDADFPDEIKVLLINHGGNPYTFGIGDRIAQGVVTLAFFMDGVLRSEQTRTGGFGSTGV